jgi:predicted dehydrogenase
VKPVRVVVTGLGGYAQDHIQAVQWLAKENLAILAGVVALRADRKKHMELIHSLAEKGIVLYDTIEHFLATGASEADVLMCAVGIHRHIPVSIAAMQAGLQVYCEKPVAGAIQEVDRLIAVKKKLGKKVAIGFQYLPTRSIRELKNRICDGRLGQVKTAKLICCWPRSENYFFRNEWAGRLRMDKSWVLDSPANNAHAHFLFNVLYLASSQPNAAANPSSMLAELYRANRIESPDLAQLRFVTDTGAQCFAIFSHCGWNLFGPIMHLECENGQARWQHDWGETMITYQNGRTERFANERHDEWRYEIVRDFMLSILENREPICTPELARPHTLTINAMHESCPEILTVPETYIVEVEDREDYPPYGKAFFRRVENHDEIMHRSYAEGKFFSKLDVPWAKRIKSYEIALDRYAFFPGDG